jgi:predicted Zn-dependent protease with MMP-like domain
VQDAIELLPKQFREALENIAIDVEELPTREALRKSRIPRGDLLLGLYSGTPLTKRGPYYGEGGALPDKITLYKRNLELICDTPDEVRREVAETLLHEVGHYFGLTERQLRELELEDQLGSAEDEVDEE